MSQTCAVPFCRQQSRPHSAFGMCADHELRKVTMAKQRPQERFAIGQRVRLRQGRPDDQFEILSFKKPRHAEIRSVYGPAQWVEDLDELEPVTVDHAYRAAAEAETAENPHDHTKFLQPESVLDEAKRIVGVDRQKQYGENTCGHIAQLWSAYLGIDLTGRDVAALMVLLKVARDRHKPKRDNATDIAGYAELMDRNAPEVVISK